MEESKDYIFTFGVGQIPGIGMFCRIKAFSSIEARTIMANRTRKYESMYDSEEKAGVQKYNLTEVFWDNGYRGWSDSPVNSGREKSETGIFSVFERGEYKGTYTSYERARSQVLLEVSEACGELTEADFHILETELNSSIDEYNRKI